MNTSRVDFGKPGFRDDRRMPRNFAVIGVGGYIAPKHMRAIVDTGNRIIAAVDPHDSVGILDQYTFDAHFFTEIERFDRHLDKLRRGADAGRVHYVSICSPNYLHDAHCRLALRVNASPICEKPLVINPWNLDALQELEQEVGCRIYTVLQLRLHPKLVELKRALLREARTHVHDICLTYITARGNWYHTSWKGSPEKSGGIATNIGVHFFDLLLWLFGHVGEVRVHYSDNKRMAGYLELERARVTWFLSVDVDDLPATGGPGKASVYRSMTIDGTEVDFTDGFADLHTRVYEEALAGQGFGIEDARPSIDLVYRIRTATVSDRDDMCHPLLLSKSIPTAVAVNVDE